MNKEIINEEQRMSCHSSTIAVLPDNKIIATWFAGSREGDNDVAIYYSIRGSENYFDIEKNWSNVRLLANIKKQIEVEDGDNKKNQFFEQPHWNPVVSYYNDMVNVFFRVGKSPWSWDTCLITGKYNMRNGEIKWGEPELVDFGPVKNKPIEMSNGQMIAGNSIESATQWKSFVDVFTKGNKLIASYSIPQPEHVGIIQPTLWESQPGHIHALMRTNTGNIYRSNSNNHGRTWCTAYPTFLPNNNSGIDVAYDENSRKLFLAFNPIWSENISSRRRCILSIIESSDNGDSWNDCSFPQDIEIGRSEYSYPALLHHQGRLMISYTSGRSNIIYELI